MSVSGGPDIITEGLVLHLDAANTESYPGTGSAWYDLSENQNDGVLTNGPSFTSSNHGSFTLDGVDDKITGISSTLINSQNGSIETWIKFTDSAALSSENMQIYAIPCPNSLKLYFYRNSPWTSNILSNFLYYRKLSNGTTGANVPYAAYYYANIWYQNVFTWSDEGVQKIYQNGSLKYSAVMSDFDYWYAPDGSDFVLGAWFSYTEGEIPQFRMYNRTLSAEQVLQNYNATRSRYGL